MSRGGGREENLSEGVTEHMIKEGAEWDKKVGWRSR